MSMASGCLSKRRRYHLQLHAAAAIFSQAHRLALVFEALQKIRVLVGAGVNALPGEDFVLSRSKSAQTEAARRICGRAPVEIATLALRWHQSNQRVAGRLLLIVRHHSGKLPRGGADYDAHRA